jgi:hypothetical protein
MMSTRGSPWSSVLAISLMVLAVSPTPTLNVASGDRTPIVVSKIAPVVDAVPGEGVARLKTFVGTGKPAAE